MTDMTTEAQMGRSEQKGSGHAEYQVYFALIFLAALPFGCASWLLTALRTMAVPRKGPVARARSQANTITPMIFIP